MSSSGGRRSDNASRWPRSGFSRPQNCSTGRAACGGNAHIEDIVEALILHRLAKRDSNRFFRLLCTLAEAADRLPSRDKAAADRRLEMWMRLLPQSEALNLAMRFRSHQRKARRDIAERTLKRVGVDPAIAAFLLAEYQTTRSQSCLEMIARSPRAVLSVDAEYLLANLDDSYWRMRVIEGLLRESRRRAYALSRKYPFEFIYAVGRLGLHEALPRLRSLFRDHSEDMEYLSLYSWTLEQLGANRDLCSLQRFVNKFGGNDGVAESNSAAAGNGGQRSVSAGARR